MQVGDVVQVKLEHWHRRGEIGLVIEDVFKSSVNQGRAFRVLFPDGEQRPFMAKNLEVISCL